MLMCPRNFGIFKHPGNASATLQLPSVSDDHAAVKQHTAVTQPSRSRSVSVSRNDQSTAGDQLRAKGFFSVEWHGKCEADKVSKGTYAVAAGKGGMYGLVFDNTFSKQLSKTATFYLLTYPTNAPPNTTQSLLHLQAGHMAAGSQTSLDSSAVSPGLHPVASDSTESIQSHLPHQKPTRAMSMAMRNGGDAETKRCHIGMLQKRRRKRGQGYARRYFSLDYTSLTLSYYYNRNSSALRGAIPLSLAAIAADEGRREISIDSGAEVWHLKANNAKDFEEWTNALEKASNTARNGGPENPRSSFAGLHVRTSGLDNLDSREEDTEWAQVEALVSRIAGTRDAVRRLTNKTSDTASKRSTYFNLDAPGSRSGGTPPMCEEGSDYFPAIEKKPFWKRKSSTGAPPIFSRTVSSQLGAPATSGTTPISARGPPTPLLRTPQSQEEGGMHEHCAALLNDLDSVLEEFSALVTKSKHRRGAMPRSAASRRSIDSTATGLFYDAETGDGPDNSQIMAINRESDDGSPLSEAGDDFISDAASTSSVGDEDMIPIAADGPASLFPIKPKSLAPLPITTATQRRATVPQALVMPPSLIGFLRKNVGKDLSTISMPVSANEPTSLLQRTAEQLEYANLLDTAALNTDAIHRLMYVTAFAISGFSNCRAKERAIRKPFNPMLGETFELVRTDKEIPGGFRLLSEKVSHRPVRIAIQADAASWSLSQSPAPTQKFWGKSAELITEGRVRVALRLKGGGDEYYSWNIATVFLRNVVMGEKYVEPVGNMTVMNETTGEKAIVEFKTKGMFGGRSEDIDVQSYDPHGVQIGVGLTGTWTYGLRLMEKGHAGKELWSVGELVDGAASTYGFTTFAASLNEITEIEEGKLPPTDCRLRPDQRAAEQGDLDTAEMLKAKLEDAQRVRRKQLEETGESHKPKWFVKVENGGGEELWRLKGGKEGYWEERAKGKWTGLENLFET